MKLIRMVFLALILTVCVNAKEEPLNISFKDLSIMDLVNITSKVIDKNILITQDIKGKVDFISNKPLYKDDIVNILIYVLEEKGFTLIENDEILRIIRLSENAKFNSPVVYGKDNNSYYQRITEAFYVKNSNVDYVASKVRHLISKAATLVTDKESNMIVITDFKKNIDTIKKVINVITQEINTSVEVIELTNINATTAKTTLINVAKSVFNFKVEKNKVVILVNKENNAITILGSKKNVKYLKDYIINIDKRGDKIKRVVEVISLKNVESKNVIKIINSIIGKKNYVDPNAKPSASTDDESNSIVLMGPKDEIAYIKELINKLDKDKLQVYVQARIIEVSENRSKNIGLTYGFAGAASNSGGIFTLGTALGGPVNALGSTLSGLVDIDTPTLDSGIALGATLNLLKNNQAIDIVSEPSILCINNKECSIYVGETRSFQTGATSTTSSSDTTNITFKREDVGLTLKVKPRISNKNKVTLEIHTILEDARELKTGQTNPDTTKKEIKTSTIVTNGESVIIGGLIKNKVDSIEDKVPLLGDIPILGNLFRNDKNVNDKINLVVIITPYIIPKSKNLTYIREQLTELKILEDKYTNDLILRLEKRKLKIQKEKIKREKKLQETKDEYNELIEDNTNKTEEEQFLNNSGR